MRRPFFAATAVLIAAACVRTNATMLGTASGPHRAIMADSVRVFRTADQIRGRYEEVALLNSTGNARSTDEAKMVASMRSKAASLGANAIILDAISEPSAGAKVAGAFLGTRVERTGKAIAVYVFADSTGPRAP